MKLILNTLKMDLITNVLCPSENKILKESSESTLHIWATWLKNLLFQSSLWPFFFILYLFIYLVYFPKRFFLSNHSIFSFQVLYWEWLTLYLARNDFLLSFLIQSVSRMMIQENLKMLIKSMKAMIVSERLRRY